MSATLAVVGDVLLDRDVAGSVERVAPEAPVPVLHETVVVTRPGGAALAALLAARDGHEVILLAPMAEDDAGAELADRLRAAGVRLVPAGRAPATPEKIRFRQGTHTLLRLDRGEAPQPPSIHAEALGPLDEADAILVSDYGRGTTADPAVRRRLRASVSRVPVVWDPHPRGAAPVPGVRLATPNRGEARRFAPGHDGDGLAGTATRARALCRRWQAVGVVVTLGGDGALLVEGSGHPLVVPAPPVVALDTCGAGDRFASSAAGRLAEGALPSEAVVAAVEAAAAFVAAGAAGSVGATEPVVGARPDADTARAAVERTRRRGGTVVATGGCFDLLHAGHVAMLRAARSLGDCLVVCLNSDASVRRLKGPGRPLVPAPDRAAVLLGLDCVDAVAVFDEDTPESVLAQLRPDVWAKGADYALADMPEAEVVRSWGGEAVVLPYLQGRSTSRLVEEVMRSGS